MAKVYARVLAEAKADAEATLAKRDDWFMATSTFVAQANVSAENQLRETVNQKSRQEFERLAMRSVGRPQPQNPRPPRPRK